MVKMQGETVRVEWDHSRVRWGREAVAMMKLLCLILFLLGMC